MIVKSRLQKILSTAGISSRRASEALILEGRVTVNGAPVTELGSKADPDVDDIRVDGRRVKIAQARRYILMYKPRGYITSRSDPQQRPTVIDLLVKGGVRGYVYPVGRLDYDSEGLLLLTSDGELAERLMHPSHEVEREYQARVLGVPDRHTIERLSKGIVIDGRRTSPADVRVQKVIEGTSGDQAVLSIVVHEGRNRQVRRMCEAVGHPVVRLRRMRIGPITDEHIRPGEFRDLSDKEVAALKRAASGTRAAKDASDSARTHPASIPQAARRKPASVSSRRAASPRTAPAPTRRPRPAPGRPRRG
jgi:23S rRNA pseudouridine2605 synthase